MVSALEAGMRQPCSIPAQPLFRSLHVATDGVGDRLGGSEDLLVSSVRCALAGTDEASVSPDLRGWPEVNLGKALGVGGQVRLIAVLRQTEPDRARNGPQSRG